MSDDIESLRRWLREKDDEVAIFKRTLDKRDAEIERLRELLRECIEWVEFKEDGGLRYAHGAPELVKRVREELGER